MTVEPAASAEQPAAAHRPVYSVLDNGAWRWLDEEPAALAGGRG